MTPAADKTFRALQGVRALRRLRAGFALLAAGKDLPNDPRDLEQNFFQKKMPEG